MKRQSTILTTTALMLLLTGTLFAQSGGSGTPVDPVPQARQSVPLADREPLDRNELTTTDRTDLPQETTVGTPDAAAPQGTTAGTVGSGQGTLPQTGSEVPLVGLLGFMALFGGIVIRALRW